MTKEDTMSDNTPNLPQLDAAKMYARATQQISTLNDQNIQMDTMIEALVEERDKAVEERDKAQAQVAELTAALSAHSDKKAAKDKSADE